MSTLLSRGKQLIGLGKGLVRPLAYSSRSKDASYPPFFIISAGRSGSTLLRAILFQHPEICLPPETHAWEKLFFNFTNFYRFLPWDFAVRLVISEFQRDRAFDFWDINLTPLYKEALGFPPEKQNLAEVVAAAYLFWGRRKKPGATRWGNKSVSNIKFLRDFRRIFPSAQFIHIVRDGRDVVSSYLKSNMSRSIYHGSRYWQKNVSGARKFLGHLPESQTLTIRYEDLVRGPESTIAELCRFLELDSNAPFLRFWENTESLGDGKMSIHTGLAKPINENAIGKWKKAFNAEERAWITEDLSPLLVELGYSTDSP